MLKKTLVVLACTPTPILAGGLSCKDASAFYHYAMYTGKIVGAVMGACATDAAQPACAALLDAVKDNGSDLDKTKEGDSAQHLLYLKDQCPDDFPESPEKF